MMKSAARSVLNVHELALPVDADAAGLLDRLARGRADRLWPWEDWPPMRLDRPLAVGASGGHGPVRYEVSEYEPGRRIRFRFTAPRGFDGFHEFRILHMEGRVVLQHVLAMESRGTARVTWPLVFRPLHDALVEDSLDKAERSLTGTGGRGRGWGVWVRLLRWALRRLAAGAPRQPGSETPPRAS